MDTKLIKAAKNDFEKYFFKLIIILFLEIKLVSEPNYHTTKRFSENLLAIEMKKTKVKKNRPV